MQQYNIKKKIRIEISEVELPLQSYSIITHWYKFQTVYIQPSLLYHLNHFRNILFSTS